MKKGPFCRMIRFDNNSLSRRKEQDVFGLQFSDSSTRSAIAVALPADDFTRVSNLLSRSRIDPVVLLNSSLTGSHPSLMCGLTEHQGILLGDDRRCKVLFKPLPGTESQAAPEGTICAKTFQDR